MGVNFIRAALTRDSMRPAAALVQHNDDLWEVSVKHPSWAARGRDREWSGSGSEVRCWQVLAAGARPLEHDQPAGWVHPVVGMLWVDQLPIWGRPGDLYTPVRVISGTNGPSQVVLEARTGPIVGGYRVNPGGTLHVDWSRWLCTRLELADEAWTVEEYRNVA